MDFQELSVAIKTTCIDIGTGILSGAGLSCRCQSYFHHWQSFTIYQVIERDITLPSKEQEPPSMKAFKFAPVV